MRDYIKCKAMLAYRMRSSLREPPPKKKKLTKKMICRNLYLIDSEFNVCLVVVLEPGILYSQGAEIPSVQCSHLVL